MSENLDIERLPLPGIVSVQPNVHSDERGFFYESFNRDAFLATIDPGPTFVQDNHSRSRRGVLRGMHYQLPPHAQGKLVRVARGAVLDVAVDIRSSSPTFRQWVAVELSEENHKQLWVPPGFAHGFLTLTESADLLYKVTDYYAPDSDRSIRWDDPDIGIDWPDVGVQPVLSEKDAVAPYLRDAQTFE